MEGIEMRRSFTYCFLGLALLTRGIFAQTELSADIVDVKQPGGPVTNKVYLGLYKARIEPENPVGYTFVVDLINHTSTILMPEQRKYFRASTDRVGAGTRQIYALLRPDDVDNACEDWLKIKFLRTETCNKVGTELVNQRRTVKYEGKCFGEICYIWIDRDLRLPVKYENKTGITEIRNVHEGGQPVSLFEIPAGYTETFTIGGTISNVPR